MRECIFCRKNKVETEFNNEHMFFAALGGGTGENVLKNVCKDCNSKLGTRVDALFINHELTKAIRFILKIEGRNGIPNPFEGIKINYDDTDISGEILTNDKGEVVGFRADRQQKKMGNQLLIISPRKNRYGYTNSILKKYGLPTVTEENFENQTLHISEPKLPIINFIEITQAGRNEYVKFAFPALLKVAYEYCYYKLGEQYLEDDLANGIRQFMIGFISCKQNSYEVPTNAQFKFNDENNWMKACRRVSKIKFCKENNVLYVYLELFNVMECIIAMSNRAEFYGEIDLSEMLIES